MEKNFVVYPKVTKASTILRKTFCLSPALMILFFVSFATLAFKFGKAENLSEMLGALAGCGAIIYLVLFGLLMGGNFVKESTFSLWELVPRKNKLNVRPFFELCISNQMELNHCSRKGAITLVFSFSAVLSLIASVGFNFIFQMMLDSILSFPEGDWVGVSFSFLSPLSLIITFIVLFGVFLSFNVLMDCKEELQKWWF